MKEIKTAIIGLDTSHSVEFPRRMQAPDCPVEQRVHGLRAVSCLRFVTPFQSVEGLDERQKHLENWGVKVTEDFDEAVADCDAIIIAINDPSLHWEYFQKCSRLQKPIFVDKPLADTFVNGQRMHDLAIRENIKIFSSSPLRFANELLEACDKSPRPLFTHVYGPLGKAPTGSSIVWYGVHVFEMLNRAMGLGARSVSAKKDSAGCVIVVEYAEGRRGVVELTTASWQYGGSLRQKDSIAAFTVNMEWIYSAELKRITEFFTTSAPPVTMNDTLEIMALLDASQKAYESGKEEPLW